MVREWPSRKAENKYFKNNNLNGTGQLILNLWFGTCGREGKVIKKEYENIYGGNFTMPKTWFCYFLLTSLLKQTIEREFLLKFSLLFFSCLQNPQDNITIEARQGH